MRDVMADGVPAAVWVVAGPPGAGKTSVARLLAARLSPPAAVLDKDIVYGGFVAAVIHAARQPQGLREGPWYDAHVKVHEYAGLAGTARDVRVSGCPVVVVAPFTNEIHDQRRWDGLVRDVGGEPVRLLWLNVEPSSLYERLVDRASPNDAAKLADYDAFVARMRPGDPPVMPHIALDNRGPESALAAQVDALVAALDSD